MVSHIPSIKQYGRSNIAIYLALHISHLTQVSREYQSDIHTEENTMHELEANFVCHMHREQRSCVLLLKALCMLNQQANYLATRT